MPNYTYQIAVKDGSEWTHDYVCAEDRFSAVCAYIEKNPGMEMQDLEDVDGVEVERCE